MTTSQKISWGVIATAILVIAVAGFFLLLPKTSFGASPAGTTSNDPKIAQENVTTATDTVFALPNTDGNARIVNGVDVYLTGGAATTSLYTIQCATSTVATGLNGNTNYIFNSTFPVTYGTTTIAGGAFYTATSSGGIVSTTTTGTVGSPASNYVNNFVRTWGASTNLVCKLTNSGAGQNNLFDPLMTGYIGFTYRPT